MLLMVQLLVAPFAHVEAFPGSDAGCEGMTHAQSSAAADTASGDCAQMAPDADGDCHQDGHHCRTHAACSCPCVHTPALAAIRPVIICPTPPSAAVGTLAAPTFESPPFELLRPPK